MLPFVGTQASLINTIHAVVVGKAHKVPLVTLDPLEFDGIWEREPDRVGIPVNDLISITVGLRNTDMNLGWKCVG